MAISYKIWDFPQLAVSGQLFRAAGQAFDGGFTSGGARVSSAEPGGRAFLEVQLSLQVQEWSYPFVSWLMSKVNGDIFSVKLAKTPQVLSNANLGIMSDTVPWAPLGNNSPDPWNNNQFWSNDGVGFPVLINALEGTTIVRLNVDGVGPVIRHGHVIGFGRSSYMVDDIEYDGDVAIVTVNPPLRRNITPIDFALTRPTFLGQVVNSQEFAANYEAMNNGHIKPPRLIFSEVIIDG